MAKYKNIGGVFRTKDGRIIKHNEVFDAKPNEIPKAFRDVIIPLPKVRRQPASTEEEKAQKEKAQEVEEQETEETK